MLLVSLAAATVTPVSTISAATADFLPQMLAVGGVAIIASAGILVLRRGWGFFRGVAR